MKKAIVYLTIFVIICFLSDSALQYSLGEEIDNQSPYYLSFASIGANLLESRLDCWAKIKIAPTNKELDQALQKILLYLKLPADEKEFLHQENNDIIISQYELSKDGLSYLIILQTNKADQESHFLMTAISLTGDIKLRNDEKKIKELLDCNSYYSYKGSIDARFDNLGQEELLRVVMKCLKAEVNDVYQQNQLISMTGFSPALKSKIPPLKVAGKNCNVQGVIRSNPKENRSEIYLGFPLLLNDY